MGEEKAFVAPPSAEVPMVEQELVRQMRVLAEAGWGAKRIARELGIARNTVRRYLRGGRGAEVQVRPMARRLDEAASALAVELWDGPAERNAVVVKDLLAERGIVASKRSVQRAVAERRRAVTAATVATVRFETAPGRQMQIDFGEKWVRIGGNRVRVYFLVAVLSFSRRCFVRAFLRQRGDDWREGVAAAFRHFGGVPLELLMDNARSLVLGRDRETAAVHFHPAFLEFCRDWDVQPKACGPYRARTKGKTESGVKYVKRNAVAGREFESFADLEAHLACWMAAADLRVHGTTHQRPIERFEAAEAAALRPLPARPIPSRIQRLRRRVANDALVDVDTIRYSVPHRLVREHVDVHVTEDQVRIFYAGAQVASHARGHEPFSRVVELSHWDGLWRRPTSVEPGPSTLAVMGRTLADYAAVVERGAA